MRTHQLVREQWIPRSLERVFPFFEKPENLGLITPPWLNFEILSPAPIRVEAGRLIDYRIRLMGWPMHWRTHIAVYQPPLVFVDEQLNGPYAYWYHLHRFEAEGEGTRLYDQVRYQLPHWLPDFMERQVHERFVSPALTRIFDYRASVFKKLFGTDQRHCHRRDFDRKESQGGTIGTTGASKTSAGDE